MGWGWGSAGRTVQLCPQGWELVRVRVDQIGGWAAEDEAHRGQEEVS